jgi:hypothetical protein|tara:strand:+ start:271 stop:486 length:216 start_codon:yes stop_codon:yes gene_type:complete
MSRLFNEFIEKVFSGNPHAHDSELGMQVDAEHEEWHAERQKWIDGKITLYNGGTVEQWVALGRPKNKNANI